MREVEEGLAQLKADLIGLKDKVELSKYVGIAISSSAPSQPTTTLMHVRLQENLANVRSLSRYLSRKAANYALSRKRRDELRKEFETGPDGDVSLAMAIAEATREAFLEFEASYPHRASEVGELLAYCIAIEQLNAAQLAAKMSLKTNSNMPVHGLDGIHASVEGEWLVLYFLESKLSQSANDGAADFAKSVSSFTTNKKQYKREYSIIRDLGNFDSLDPKSRKIALQYFDVMASPEDAPRRERYVGVVLYSDAKLFNSLSSVDNAQQPGFHESELAIAYAKNLAHHQQAAMKHLENHGADPYKCLIYFVVVPDVGELRQMFYDTLGYVPKVAKL